jgi:hypothetical protein
MKKVACRLVQNNGTSEANEVRKTVVHIDEGDEVKRVLLLPEKLPVGFNTFA